MSKLFSTISLIGVVALMGYEYLQAIDARQKIQSFVSAGPRFTSQDGQELCERVRALEATSYGYRAVGKLPQPCAYLERR